MNTHILPSIWIASSATWVAISELYKITAAQSYIVNMHTSANVHLIHTFISVCTRHPLLSLFSYTTHKLQWGKDKMPAVLHKF